MSTNPTQANRPISIQTPLGDDVLLLRSFSFREELGRPFQMHLELQSVDDAIAFERIIGQKVTVQVAMPTYGAPRYFNGYVSTFRQTGFTGDLANYRAVVVPWLWLLTRTSDCRIYQNLSVPDIVKDVFRRHGFSDFQDQLAAPAGAYPVVPFCVQYNETDFQFVSRLMEGVGIYYYFDHTDTTDVLVLADGGTAHGVFDGYSTIPYNPEKTLPHGTEHIYEWTIQQEVQPGSWTLDDYNYEQPNADLLETAAIPQSYAYGSYDRFAYPGDYQTGDEGQDLATVRIQADQARQTVQRGVTNALGIAVGYRFKFTNYPRADQNVDLLTTRMVLRIETADFSTADSGQAEYSRECRFQTLMTSRPFRPARTTPKPRVAGLQTATVVGTAGALVDADDYGNVIVQFHWDRQGRNNENSSCRIRVSQNSAGDGWGSMFLPYIGNEVIVCFEDGDPDRPVVTGRVYNAAQMPPQNPKTSPNVSYLEDASKQNLLSLDATSGAEKVVLKNAANVLTMDSTTGAQKITLTDGASSIVFDPNAGSVTTTTPGDQNTTNEGNTHKWTWGEWSEWVLGLKVTNVIGGAWNAYVGFYSKLVGGLDFSIIAGAKLEYIVGPTYKMLLGWELKSPLCGKGFKTPALIWQSIKTFFSSGQKTEEAVSETKTIAGTYAVTAGLMNQKVNGALTMEAASTLLKSTAATTLTAASVSVTASNMVDITASTDIILDGTTVYVNGNFIELG